MARSALCTVDYCEVQDDNGRAIDGVEVRCQRCGHCAKGYGQSEGSVRYALRELHTTCPNKENNYYKVSPGMDYQKSADEDEDDFFFGRSVPKPEPPLTSDELRQIRVLLAQSKRL